MGWFVLRFGPGNGNVRKKGNVELRDQEGHGVVFVLLQLFDDQFGWVGGEENLRISGESCEILTYPETHKPSPTWRPRTIDFSVSVEASHCSTLSK
jgi:hypothetical protein